MTDYSKLKVAELRDVLKERGIPSTGLSRKQQIIDALEAHDAKQPDHADNEVSADVPDAGATLENNDGGEAHENDDGGEAIVEKEKDAVPEDALEKVQETVEDAQEVLNGGNVGHAGVEDADAAMGDAAAENEQEVTAELVVDTTASLVPEDHDPVATTVAPAALQDEPMESQLETPRQLSPTLEGQSSETRKRKRRSPTPPPSSDSINKKLKSAGDELVKLPEDNVVGDAPVSLEPSSDAVDSMEILPYGTSDDVMQITDVPANSELPSLPLDGPPPPQVEHEDNVTLEDPTMRASSPIEDDSAPPSIHPRTRSLYIRDFIRPLSPQQLREHLTTLAARAGEEEDETVVTKFHLDNIRTHAFASFASTSAASRVRSALHGRVWPEESQRKPLWVDYIPDDKVQEWIDREMESGNNKRDVRRWEVEYTSINDGTVTVSLQEITAPTGPRRRSSFSNPAPTQVPGLGMMNAPTGPRSQRPPAPIEHPADRLEPAIRKQSTTSNNTTSASFDILDERFSSTTVKPKIYYLPVASDLAEKRLDELERTTSRTWDNGRAMKKASGVEQQSRRYTFEDGSRIVDGGVDAGYGYRGPGGGNFGGAPRGGYRGGRGGGRGWR
ncbi:hypothetical protein LTR09_000228 [Extremus antarcticus]|uniref:RRM domain-containing protein n=1 Tax=Extremus antarcticus TaxID=702011 RepID=A0AAJ0LX02_9PEZI|nr:hypothetical protein LTR09_000228 [Extremus antarcticus]